MSDVIRHFLEEVGYNVDVPYGGQEATKKVCPTTDLILLDVMLPKLNGFEVCGRLRSKIETEKIPVIFLTARAEEKEDHIRKQIIEGHGESIHVESSVGRGSHFWFESPLSTGGPSPEEL